MHGSIGDGHRVSAAVVTKSRDAHERSTQSMSPMMADLQGHVIVYRLPLARHYLRRARPTHVPKATGRFAMGSWC